LLAIGREPQVVLATSSAEVLRAATSRGVVVDLAAPTDAERGGAAA